MDKILWAIIVVGGLVALFFLFFWLNRKTPKPEGCENLEAECSSCPIKTCLKNTSNKEDQK